jgi:hypothetical protein
MKIIQRKQKNTLKNSYECVRKLTKGNEKLSFDA